MRKLLALGILILSLAQVASAQTQSAKLKIRVVLVDGDLNQKPAPRLELKLAPTNGSTKSATSVRTGFDGTAEIELAPGEYRVETPVPLEFSGKQYTWSREFTVSAPESSLELSNDNAATTTIPRESPARIKQDLTDLFKKYQNSVVTVWTELGQGTGFIVDRSGLILTNQHVVGRSEFVAVQFDDQRKIAAKVLASDIEKDVAVVWANISAFPEAIVAPLARTSAGNNPAAEATVAEGEWVFTIGSPLNQRKILTQGIVSKIEPRVILSDIVINHGSSGGPLFNSSGTVVGLTTFGQGGGTGQGIAGIVRIEQAELPLQRAKTKMADLTPPATRLLPVEPTRSYSMDVIKTYLAKSKFDRDLYVWKQGDYDVAIITPVLQYWLTEGVRIQAQKQKDKRTSSVDRAVQGTFQPLDDLKDWREYVTEFKPVIVIEAHPQLGRDRHFDFSLKDLLSDEKTIRLKFKTDFYRMKLLCDAKEIEPIQPGKVEDVLDIHNKSYDIRDATFSGVYSYPYDAISKTCETVTLQLFSESQPDNPVSKTLSPKTIMRITQDFAAFSEK